MIQSELRALLLDCLTLWAVQGQVEPAGDGMAIETADGSFTVHPADPDLRPVRWFLQTPERVAAHRPPRAAPSVVALLSALRNALGGEGGRGLRIGSGNPGLR